MARTFALVAVMVMVMMDGCCDSRLVMMLWHWSSLKLVITPLASDPRRAPFTGTVPHRTTCKLVTTCMSPEMLLLQSFAVHSCTTDMMGGAWKNYMFCISR